MTNLKFYIGSALILLFLIGAFIIWNRYLNRLETNDNREYELSTGELNRKIQNDSAKHIIDSLENVITLKEKENEFIERQKLNVRNTFLRTTKGNTSSPASEQSKMLIRRIEE